MRVITWLFLAVCLRAQVFAPAEIADERARGLQQKHFADLKTIANEVKSHAFPYRFYFSRVLDVSERQQLSSDQRAIQFDSFQGKLILKVTGNYFASYPAGTMDREQRARQTFDDVMVPILRSAVRQLRDCEAPESYALEISHHVRKNVLGVETEGVENVVLVLPTGAANEVVAAKDAAQQNAALLKAAAFVDGKPITFWPDAERSLETKVEHAPVTAAPEQQPETFERMVRALDSQAHFVAYAAPAFIQFRQLRYLQLSLTTNLAEQTGGSQYRLAALAFDEHIAHLIRPVLPFLKSERDLDGVDFSTTVHFDSGGAGGSVVAVEFLFPIKELLRYEKYDCTGQQLLDSGFVLINGERVTLSLQAAESR